MFGKLKKFELVCSYWWCWFPLEIFCGINTTLEHLAITLYSSFNVKDRLIFKSFRALKTLRLIKCRDVLVERELQECFYKNNITSLELTDFDNIDFFKPNSINSLINSLETLTIDYFNQIDPDQLFRLKNF